MHSKDLTNAYLLLTANYPTLRRSFPDLRREGVANKRYETTWHHGHLPVNWAHTIGMWGGVATVDEIQAVAGVNYATLKMFRHRHSLTARPKKTQKQWKLASGVFLTYVDRVEKTDIPLLCADYGILPVEAKLYVERMVYLTADLELVTPDELPLVPAERVEELWNEKYYVKVENVVSQQYT